MEPTPPSDGARTGKHTGGTSIREISFRNACDLYAHYSRSQALKGISAKLPLYFSSMTSERILGLEAGQNFLVTPLAKPPTGNGALGLLTALVISQSCGRGL
jgi:hypothetical protein